MVAMKLGSACIALAHDSNRLILRHLCIIVGRFTQVNFVMFEDIAVKNRHTATFGFLGL